MKTIIEKLRWNIYGRNNRVNALIAEIEYNRIISTRVERLDNYRKPRVTPNVGGNTAS